MLINTGQIILKDLNTYILYEAVSPTFLVLPISFKWPRYFLERLDKGSGITFTSLMDPDPTWV